MIKYTSIEKMANTWATMNKYALPAISFIAKIKLHGTNGGVIIKDGEVTAQSRNNHLIGGLDNAGFAAWVSTVEWLTDKDIVIYGEWAGKGIQERDAITKIDGKMFFVFAVLDVETQEMIVDPAEIGKFIPSHKDIKVLPIYEVFMLDVQDRDGAIQVQDWIVEEVSKIGEVDPYVKSNFAIEGPGEGLVAVPVKENGRVDLFTYNQLCFKVKSEAHSVQKNKKVASISVESPDVLSFADMFVTDVRCEQMLKEHCGGKADPKLTGTFLKALHEDVIKESKLELETTWLEWKDVVKSVSKRATAWYRSKQMI